MQDYVNSLINLSDNWLFNATVHTILIYHEKFKFYNKIVTF